MCVTERAVCERERERVSLVCVCVLPISGEAQFDAIQTRLNRPRHVLVLWYQRLK